MSIEVDSDESGQGLQDDNETIIRLLKAQIWLLEIIASVEHGEAIEAIED